MPVHPAPPALVLADRPGQRAERIAHALGAPLAPLSRARGESVGVNVIFAFAPLEAIPALVLRLCSLRSRALIVSPLGEPGPLPRWNAPIARFCFPSQAEARRWLPYIPLGRLVVVEPGPAAQPHPESIYVATASDALDPEPIVAAAAGGAAIVSPLAHACLPPGAVVEADVEAAREALLNDPDRCHTLGRLSRDWALRGRTTAAEAASILAIAAELRSMSTRGGRPR